MATPPAVRKHPFSKDIVNAVKRCSRSDNWHGLLETAEHWLAIAAWIWISCWACQHLPVAPAAAVYLPAVFFIGGRQRGLAGVLHQACHGTLMSSPRLGFFVGALLAGYPVLQSFTGYRRSHVANHHGRLGDPRLDPDYVQYQRNGLCGGNLGRDTLRRYLFSIAGPRATLSYIGYLVRYRILAAGEQPWESAVRVIFLAAAVAVAGAGGWLGVVVAYWLVPLVTTQVWIGAIAELLEHYPLIESAPRIDIHMSWNRRLSPVVRFLLGEKAGEGYHLAHHLFPQVPLWRLAEVDAILRADPAYAGLMRLEGMWEALSSILASMPPKAKA